VEESNAIQRADAYYQQLGKPIDRVEPVSTSEELLTLCKRIQKLIPGVIPEDPTHDFMAKYSGNQNMCRTYNYFNREMAELLKHPLTKGTSEKVSSEKVSSEKVSNPLGKASNLKQNPIDINALDQLALAIYQADGENQDTPVRDVEALDQLATAIYRLGPV